VLSSPVADALSRLLFVCTFLLPLLPPPPRSTLFPYTTLFRSSVAAGPDLRPPEHGRPSGFVETDGYPECHPSWCKAVSGSKCSIWPRKREPRRRLRPTIHRDSRL